MWAVVLQRMNAVPGIQLNQTSQRQDSSNASSRLGGQNASQTERRSAMSQ